LSVSTAMSSWVVGCRTPLMNAHSSSAASGTSLPTACPRGFIESSSLASRSRSSSAPENCWRVRSSGSRTMRSGSSSLSRSTLLRSSPAAGPPNRPGAAPCRASQSTAQDCSATACGRLTYDYATSPKAAQALKATYRRRPWQGSAVASRSAADCRRRTLEIRRDLRRFVQRMPRLRDARPMDPGTPGRPWNHLNGSIYARMRRSPVATSAKV
jgi:hypothetical protein